MIAGSDDSLIEHFAFLVDERGFQIAARRISPFFGNAELVLEGDGIVVHISRDRGDIYVNVGRPSDGGASEDLNIIRNLLLRLDPAEDASVAQQASFLRRHYSAVRELFSERNFDDTKRMLTELSRERLRRLFPGAVIDDA